MRIHKGCTYWYEVSIHVDKKEDSVKSSAKVRIPVRCENVREHYSECILLNPSTASVERKLIPNEYLFDNPYYGE
jgi:hypothetical protein